MRGPGREKLLVRFGSELTKKNCQCSVVCALRVKEVTPFSLEEEAYLYLREEMLWKQNWCIVVTV